MKTFRLNYLESEEKPYVRKACRICEKRPASPLKDVPADSQIAFNKQAFPD